MGKSEEKHTCNSTHTLNSSFVRCDGSTLDTNVVLQDSVGAFHSDVVIGLISVRKTEIEVLDVQIKVGQDELCVGEVKLGRAWGMRMGNVIKHATPNTTTIPCP